MREGERTCLDILYKPFCVIGLQALDEAAKPGKVSSVPAAATPQAKAPAPLAAAQTAPSPVAPAINNSWALPANGAGKQRAGDNLPPPCDFLSSCLPPPNPLTPP